MYQALSYNQQYQQLEVLQTNLPDSFKVYLVKERSTGQYRTAKKTSIFNTSQQSQDKLLNQIKILKQLSNPHIIKYFDVFLEGDQFIVILEFCEEGDLNYYAQRKKQKKENFSEKLILSWILQILMALEYVHSKNIIHRMVCSQNIYMNHQGDLKLGSFGSAKMLENTMEKAMTVVGSVCNLSPEIVEGKSYDNKIDIWGLGCLIFQLATHQHPYKISSLPELYEMIVKGTPQDLPVKYSKYLNPIYKKMMKKNPNFRPSASELLQQQVFIKLMKEYTKKKKIDSLDLRQVIPKQLLSHKNKNSARILPPIVLSKSPTLTSQNSKIKDKTPQTVRKSTQKYSQSQSNIRYKQSNSNIPNYSKLPSLTTGRTSQSQQQNIHTSPKTAHKQKSKQKQQPSLPTIQKNDKKTSPKIPKSKPASRNQNAQNNGQSDKKTQKNQQEKSKQKPKQKEKQQITAPTKKQLAQIPAQKQNQQENQNRLTLPDLMQGEYISLLCQIKLELLEKKYSPNMSQIFEQTIEIDQQS